MEIIRQFVQDSKNEHWIDGFNWLLWSLLGFLPIPVTMLMLKLYSQPFEISAFTDNGEFAIYSATYLGAALYFVMKDVGQKIFPSRSSIAFVLIALLLCSAVLYAEVALNNFLNVTGGSTNLLKLDKQVVRVVSQWLLPSVFLLTYFIVVAENIRSSPDPAKIFRKQLNELENKFDELAGGDNE